jgi:hypothetical protein
MLTTSDYGVAVDLAPSTTVVPWIDESQKFIFKHLFRLKEPLFLATSLNIHLKLSRVDPILWIDFAA